MNTSNYKVLALIAVLLFVGVIALATLEMRMLDNTIDGWKLMRKTALMGLILGLILAIFFQRKYAFKEAVPTMRLWLVCLLVPTFILPVFASFINHAFAKNETSVLVEFLEEKPLLSESLIFSEGQNLSPEAYHLYVFMDGKIERFTKKSPCCQNKESGDQISLNITKGVFGYDFVRR